MKASIYISSKEIKLLVYTKTSAGVIVRQYHNHKLPDEAVLGGVILDSAAVTEGIRALKSRFRGGFSDLSLVLDGSFVYSRKLSIPSKLPTKMYRSLIRDEFSDVAAEGAELICEYVLLRPTDSTSENILAFGVEASNLSSYVEAFSAAGVQLSSMHLGIHTLLHYISRQRSLAESTFVLNAIDEEQMISIIFQNNTWVFQQRTRLFPDSSGSSAQSILTGLSGIIEFNSSQNFNELSHSLYLGLSENDVSHISAMSEYPNIQFGIPNILNSTRGAEQLPPDAFFLVLNAIMPDSKRDLFHSMKMQKKEKKQQRPKKPFIPIAAALILVLGAAFAFFMFRISQLEREVNNIQSFLTSPATIELREEAETLIAHTARINALYSAAANRTQQIDAMPQLSRELLSTVENLGRPNILILNLGFNSANRNLSVSAIAPNMNDSSSYV